VKKEKKNRQRMQERHFAIKEKDEKVLLARKFTQRCTSCVFFALLLIEASCLLQDGHIASHL